MIKKNDNLFLVIGMDGFIGQSLYKKLQRHSCNVFGTVQNKKLDDANQFVLDLSTNISDWFFPHHFSTVYLCAAISSLEICRNEPEKTRYINVENTINLAKKFGRQGAKVVFLSSNLVFDGEIPFVDPECQSSPKTEYGRQKAETERELISLNINYCIVRLTKVIGPYMPLFKNWCKALDQDEVIHPFNDMVFSPIPLDYVLDSLISIPELNTEGILQISGDRDISYAQAASYIGKRLGKNEDLIKPIMVKDSNIQFEYINRFTTLDSQRLHKELGIPSQSVWDSIDTVIN